MPDISAIRDKLFLRRIGGRIVSYEEAETAYREGKLVNLAEYCPDVFNTED